MAGAELVAVGVELVAVVVADKVLASRVVADIAAVEAVLVTGVEAMPAVEAVVAEAAAAVEGGAEAVALVAAVAFVGVGRAASAVNQLVAVADALVAAVVADKQDFVATRIAAETDSAVVVLVGSWVVVVPVGGYKPASAES